MAYVEIDLSRIEKKMLKEEAQKRDETLQQMCKEVLLSEIRDYIWERYEPSENNKNTSVFCLDCRYEPESCGEDVEDCLEEAELYFEGE